MKRLAVLALICVAFLALSGCGKPPMGSVFGYVTDGQGGPAVVGATVSCQTYTTTTDANGYFELKIEADKPSDLMIAKDTENDHRASTRVQQISVGKDQRLELAIFNRPAFNPLWSVQPPTISVSSVVGTGATEVVAAIVRGQKVSGTIKLRIATTGQRNVNKIYAYLGGDQRTPRAASVFDVTSADVTVNTALYPNGPSTIRVLVYDDNENATLYLVPVVVENLPAQVSYLGITSTSYGVNVGYYAKRRVAMSEKGLLKGDPYLVRLPSGRTVDLRVAPANSTVFVKVSWAPVAGAAGYAVYRSADKQNYVLVGRVTSGSALTDYSALLTPGVEVTYKVAAYNAAGEGPSIIRSVTPLAPFNVLLREPANEALDVSLTPTFRWEKSISGQFAPDVEIYTTIELYDATSAQIWGEDLAEYNADDPMFIAYPGALEPVHVYSWDISSCVAYRLYEDVDDGYSESVSYAGEISDTGGSSGSTNGTFVFTTTATAAE